MRNLLYLIFIGLLTASCATGQEYINHNLSVDIKIDSQIVNVTDLITLPYSLVNQNPSPEFTLRKGFEVKSEATEYKIIKIGDEGEKISRYKIEFNKHPSDGHFTVKISYMGKIKGEIKQSPAEYARGFSETDGIICDQGIFFAGSTFWVPNFYDNLVTFSMNVVLDKPWSIVTQGMKINIYDAKGGSINRYDCLEPMEEVYLIAAPWREYNFQAGHVLVQAFLRSPDETLANKYFGVTNSYLEDFERMIGPYPYQKFALVENFWETGYGMPSFTLLGEKVIRFPWILVSSYPHELLHNWWGNSVYIEPGKGNWCEGITSYMADHLMAEKKGTGAEYRRNTLEKFTDFVRENNDFPLTNFVSRNDASQEAIGYGKSLMMNHMLRMKLGDEKFREAYRLFYESFRFKKATFDDIRGCFEKVTNADLKAFFDQWVSRTGAPKIELSNVAVNMENKKYVLDFTLTQTQKEDVFNLDIPLAIWFEGDTMATIEIISLVERTKSLKHTFDKRPLRIDVDPQFDIFRRLDKREVPATISRMLGSTKVLMIIPKTAPKPEIYSTLTAKWKPLLEAQEINVTIVKDSAKLSLDGYDAIWILGNTNKYVSLLKPDNELKKWLTANEVIKWDTASNFGTLIQIQPNANNPEQTLGFINVNHEAMIAGLLRKLPHYGKYSYLGFKNESVDNILKGIFPVANSPLGFNITYKKPVPVVIPKYPTRKPLSDI